MKIDFNHKKKFNGVMVAETVATIFALAIIFFGIMFIIFYFQFWYGVTNNTLAINSGVISDSSDLLSINDIIYQGFYNYWWIFIFLSILITFLSHYVKITEKFRCMICDDWHYIDEMRCLKDKKYGHYRYGYVCKDHKEPLVIPLVNNGARR